MKTKVRCVAAFLQPPAEGHGELTMFRFQPVDGQVAGHAQWWFEGGLVVYDNKGDAYRVGDQYTFTLEVSHG